MTNEYKLLDDHMDMSTLSPGKYKTVRVHPFSRFPDRPVENNFEIPKWILRDGSYKLVFSRALEERDHLYRNGLLMVAGEDYNDEGGIVSLLENHEEDDIWVVSRK